MAKTFNSANISIAELNCRLGFYWNLFLVL